MIDRIVTVIGARPQFIKAAPVSRALAAAGVVETVVHTGQHYDESMSAVFFSELELVPPSVHLGAGSASHAVQTAAILTGVENVISSMRPEMVLVYGDTNSTLAGALAAAKLHVPVAHVEAGLRSGNMRMPEEINRILTDRLAELLFTPTSAATAHLRQEGVSGVIDEVGDVMFDATLMFSETAEQRSDVVARLGLQGLPFVLATAHRAETTDDIRALTAVLDGLGRTADDLNVVLPLHPRTAKAIRDTGVTVDARIRVIEPVGYLDMLMLERSASVIVTDSGGVQKEAFFQRTPCVTLRTETEWPELVEAGWNRLVAPTDGLEISRAILSAVGTAGAPIDPYGDGSASSRISQSIRSFDSSWFR